MKAKVICISGKAQHGKDTVGRALKGELERRGDRVLVTHYGDLVKYVCSYFFDWDYVKDQYGRQLLQHVGTDVVRAHDENYWVDFVSDMVEMFDGMWDWVLIPDTRFPNEISRMSQKFDTVHLRVVRPGFESSLTEEQKEHSSETSLDDSNPDYTVVNDGTWDGLCKEVNKFIEEVLYAD